MTVADRIAHACKLAEELGTPVFPLRVEPDPQHPGKTIKRPLVKGWQNDATTNPEAIEALFKRFPQATHVGLQTGERSRLLLVDLDGEPGLKWWRENQALLPPTRTQRTRREGGKHLFYRMPVGCPLRNSAGKIAPGVDIRASGGFACDWSIDYPPDTDEVADAPQRLLDILERATAEAAPARTRELANGAAKIGDGARHDALKSIAASFRRKGLKGSVLEAALSAWNTEHCDPPQDQQDVARLARDFSVKDGDSLAEEPVPWPDPVNILGELAAPEFTGDELPAVLSEFALAYSKSTGFDPSLTLSAAVSVAAAALSDGFRIVGDSRSQWFQQARLWLLAIGRPGTGKTPVQKAMLGPLWAVHRELRQAWERERAALMQSESEEKAPPPPKVIIADATIEALSEALRENPRGLLIANDEFESWLGSHDVYRSGGVSRDRGEWLRLFDGGPHTIERIKRGSVFVENWGASILTATTPAALAKLTRSLPEDGLLQRFIPIMSRRQGEGRTVETLESARTGYTQTITRLYTATARAHNGCVSLSLEAQKYLRDWLKQNQVTQEAFGALEPALEAHLAKYPSFLLRLTLTFHAAAIVNLEDQQARDPAAWPVPLSTIQIAAGFLKRARSHAIALYLDRKSGNDAFELARAVALTIIARGWQRVERRNLLSSVRAFRKADENLQHATLRLLMDLYWLRYAEGGYLKATPARYDVNPALAGKYAAEARREQQRRAIIRDEIAQTLRDRKNADE